MNNVGDRELIENCMNGDKRAFEGLLSRYEKPVFNAAYRICSTIRKTHEMLRKRCFSRS